MITQNDGWCCSDFYWIRTSEVDPKLIFDMADSTWKCSSQLLKKMNAGVFLSRHLRGLELSFCSTSAIWSSVIRSKSVPFGKYCRMRPLVFSLRPRSQELYGWAKYDELSNIASIMAWDENSLPLSKVRVWSFDRWGRSLTIIAIVTASAVLLGTFAMIV